MLISKGIAVGEIVTVKTTSGEELLAKLVERTDSTITVSRPVVLTAGSKGIALVPYLFTTDPDANIVINMNNVIVMAATGKDAADQYIQQTTGIKLA
jgi:small nuclear ribonucleoprotein (snRNP)-like protein